MHNTGTAGKRHYLIFRTEAVSNYASFRCRCNYLLQLKANSLHTTLLVLIYYGYNIIIPAKVPNNANNK